MFLVKYTCIHKTSHFEQLILKVVICMYASCEIKHPTVSLCLFLIHNFSHTISLYKRLYSFVRNERDAMTNR